MADKRDEAGGRIIRASEIGEYSYCARAWWYKHVVKLPVDMAGESGGRLVAGIEAHRQHGLSVARAGRLRAFALVLALGGIAILLLTVLLSVAR